MKGAHYHNTTGLVGEELLAEVRTALRQEDAILAIYRSAKGPLSPADVLRQCEAAGKRWPITSVRRAIHELTDAALLTKLDLQKPGLYGKPEHLWQLTQPQRDLFGAAP